MLADVLDWEEFQKIIEEYDMVLVMAYLVGPQSSTDALKIYEEYSRRIFDARFFGFNATSEGGKVISQKLGIKYAPMVFSFKNGERVREYMGHVKSGIEEVIKSVVDVEVVDAATVELEW